MATLVRRPGPNGRKVWQVRIRKKGWPQRTRTFDLKSDAVAWAKQVELEIDRGTFLYRAEAEATTLAEALERYRAEVLPRKRSPAETGVLNRWLRHPLAQRPLPAVRGKDVAQFVREREAEGAGPNTIRLDLALLSHLYTVARSAWGLESLVNPVALIRGSRPRLPRGRDRRLLHGEQERLLAACRAYGRYGAYGRRVGRCCPIEGIVIFALETAMRRGEIAAMRWEHLDREARVLRVPETKTDTPRRVPLSTRAVAVLDAIPRRREGSVWGLSRTDLITESFREAVRQARSAYEAECRERGEKPDPRMLRDLRFHDLRHEATSRLFEKGLNPMQVAAITGHKTLQMLKRYTHLRAEDLVGLLG